MANTFCEGLQMINLCLKLQNILDSILESLPVLILNSRSLLGFSITSWKTLASGLKHSPGFQFFDNGKLWYMQSPFFNRSCIIGYLLNSHSLHNNVDARLVNFERMFQTVSGARPNRVSNVCCVQTCAKFQSYSYRISRPHMEATGTGGRADFENKNTQC